MNLELNDLTMRPITGRELEPFCRLPYALNEELADDLDSGRRRPEWMRMALRGDRLVARLAWWGRHRESTPLVLDLRLEWRPGTPIPAPSTRLRFRPVGDREELIELMTLVLEGTLDAHSRFDLGPMPAAQAAAEQYDGEFMSYKSPSDWWRIATLPGGEPVGFVIPARNSYNPIIAYIGVLPAHRGKGHVDDLLAEGTRILAAQDVPRIRAATDLDNVPMAQAFQRAGYVNFEREIAMTWS